MIQLNYKVRAWAAVVAFIGLMTWYVFEFQYFANTFDFKGLLWRSLFAGLLLGIFLGWRFYQYGAEQVDKIRIWTACLLLPVAFSPFIGSVTNRVFSLRPTELKSYEFFQEKPFAEELYGIMQGEQLKPDGYYVFILHEGELVRLKSKKQRFKNARSGDQVVIPVKKGIWGYELVNW